MMGGIQVKIYPFEDRTALQGLWVRLQQHSQSPFLQWPWINQWLKHCAYRVYVVEAVMVGQPEQRVGIGLISEHDNTLGVQRTGNKRRDQIWPEHNDFLMVEDNRTQIRQQMLTAVLEAFPAHYRLLWGAANAELQPSVTEGYVKRVVWQAPSYVTDFSKWQSDNLESALSKSARSQIRRSHKKYAELGEIMLTRAESGEQITRYFDAMATLHKQRWGEDSGFHNQVFRRFHYDLLQQDANKGAAKRFTALYRITAGEHDLGYLYVLLAGEGMAFYLSAFDYTLANSQRKPGLLAHAMLIQRAYDHGLSHYDFLAGEARYKHTFTNHVEPMAIIEYRRNTPKVRTYALLRQLKSYLGM
uniref:GNAT family N-acetyltransferase n=1 Tax=Thaumasiovibrio occultus TaxID=1891184 RepID=UPI000B35F78C|nr:GNAT family N-acetyltransferase [Thaumasiovibrio occultus]